ncbi:MAG TPA: GNAT family N-acetyltransferase [Noviherbaspirillum sp.]|nr:GNAT family N-acetyltransferase [Noviherbaspirillum sp.]
MSMSNASVNASINANVAPLGPHAREATPAPLTTADIVTATCHDNEVPPFAEAELERLYGNIYSSLRQFRIDGTLAAPTSTYVERKAGEITAVYLFQRSGRKVRVLNEGITIGAEELQRFSSYLFFAYPSLDLVSFHAVRPATEGLAFPYHRYGCLEDIVLTLPESRVAYLDSMGNSTRNYIKRYLNKLKRTYPSFSHRIYVRDEIDEQQVRDIVRLNSARMAEKGKIAGIGEQDEQRIVRLMRECGMLSVILIDGRICAGTINYQVGDNYFLEVIAHDPAYNEYRLGTLCCYLTICECIARGGNEYHFLWGRNEYKYRLLGVERALDHLTIYRSQWHRCLHLRTTLGNIGRSAKRKGQIWLHEAEGREDPAARLAAAIAHAIRHVRHGAA